MRQYWGWRRPAGPGLRAGAAESGVQLGRDPAAASVLLVVRRLAVASDEEPVELEGGGAVGLQQPFELLPRDENALMAESASTRAGGRIVDQRHLSRRVIRATASPPRCLDLRRRSSSPGGAVVDDEQRLAGRPVRSSLWWVWNFRHLPRGTRPSSPRATARRTAPFLRNSKPSISETKPRAWFSSLTGSPTSTVRPASAPGGLEPGAGIPRGGRHPGAGLCAAACAATAGSASAFSRCATSW